MLKVTELLLKLQKSLRLKTKFRIPKETFYIFIKVVKFLTKFNLFPYLRKRNTVDELQLDSLKLINDVISSNLLKYEAKITIEEEYFKLPGLGIIFELTYLTLLYHNDAKVLRIIQKNDKNKVKFAYEYDIFNQGLTEAVKIFGNTIALRNICKKVEVYTDNDRDDIEINYFFFALKYSFLPMSAGNCEYYDTLQINLIIKDIFDLLIGNSIKGNYSYSNIIYRLQR